MKPFVLLLSLLGLLCSCITDDDAPTGEERIRPGDPLPAFTVTMYDGTTLSTEDLRGSVSLVVFFHTGCPDCQKELPVLQQLYEAYGGLSSEVRFVCISREEGEADIAAYWAANSLTLPYSPQEDKGVYHLFADSAIPRVYVADRNLTVRAVYTDSPVATYEQLDAWVKELS